MSKLEKSVNTLLQYIVPLVTGINIPLSLINIIVFVNTGILNSPSNFIYFNLVIMDLLNSAVGVTVSIDMWNDPDHSSPDHWGNGTLHELIDGYLYIFILDANIFLVFGLVLIRVLWIRMSALTVIRRLKQISLISVGLAYSLALKSCLYVYFAKFPKKKEQFYPDTYIEVSDLTKCLVILITISLSVYTQIRIRCYKSQLNESIYRSASWTSFVLTLNLAVSYSYYLVVNGTRIYAKARHKVIEETCASPQDWTWNDVFLCDSLYIGVSFMCLNRLVNSIILLCEVKSKQQW